MDKQWLWKDEEEEVDEEISQDLEDIEQIGNLGLEGVNLSQGETQT